MKMNFSSHSQQMPKQFQPECASTQQAHVPSQINQSYYHPTSYPHYQNPQQMQDFSSYYNTQFVNGYDQQQQLQQQQFSQLESESPVIHPPGVSAQPDEPPQPAEGVDGAAPGVAPGMESGQVPDQQNVYYPVHGVNPAAAAAAVVLAQITQIAGALGAFLGTQCPVMGGLGFVSGPGLVPGPEPVPRPMYAAGDSSPYRGGGRRAGCSFRGRGQDNIGNHRSRTGNLVHEIGCAQGTAGSADLQKHGASSSHSEPATAAEKVKSKGEDAEPLGGTVKKGDIQPQTPMVPSGSATKNQQPTQGAFCELCKVDCNSLEILEQHMNGKRHKKKLQRPQQLNNANIPGAERGKVSVPFPDSNPEAAPQLKVTTKVDESKESLQEHLLTTVLDKMEIEQSNDNADLLHTSGNSLSDCLVSEPGHQICSLKRKRKAGHGRKQVKTVDTPSGSLKPEKPKIVIPFICDLCNVRCDTIEGFNRHLSGKKHVSKFKRFEAHRAMFGALGLQALYPPSSVSQNLFHQQGPQQASCPPLGADASPPNQNANPAATGTVSGIMPNPNQQIPNGTPQFG